MYYNVEIHRNGHIWFIGIRDIDIAQSDWAKRLLDSYPAVAIVGWRTLRVRLIGPIAAPITEVTIEQAAISRLNNFHYTTAYIDGGTCTSSSGAQWIVSNNTSGGE